MSRGTKNVDERMSDEIRLARIADAAGKALGDAESLLGLAEQQSAAVGGQKSAVDLLFGNR